MCTSVNSVKWALCRMYTCFTLLQAHWTLRLFGHWSVLHAKTCRAEQAKVAKLHDFLTLFWVYFSEILLAKINILRTVFLYLLYWGIWKWDHFFISIFSHWKVLRAGVPKIDDFFKTLMTVRATNENMSFLPLFCVFFGFIQIFAFWFILSQKSSIFRHFLVQFLRPFFQGNKA